VSSGTTFPSGRGRIARFDRRVHAQVALEIKKYRKNT
jgi:hypothetical protein